MARIANTSMEEITSDPTKWANSVMKTSELFDFDGVVVGFHFSLMPEASGCGVRWEQDRPVLLPPDNGLCESPADSSRMKHALEAAGRIFQVSRSNRACIAALAGPVTLLRNLFGDTNDPSNIRTVKSLLVSTVEAFCVLRPDVLIFMESNWSEKDCNPKPNRLYSTLKKITSHYGVVPGIYVQDYTPQDTRALSDLDMGVYVFGPTKAATPPSIDELWDIGAETFGFGVGLPMDDLDAAQATIDKALDVCRSRGGKGLFFTSHGPLTREASPEILHELTARIRQSSL